MDDITATSPRTCRVCHESFSTLAILRHVVTCPQCVAKANADELAAWQVAMGQELPALVNVRLGHIGLSPMELLADLKRVPVPLKRVLPRADVEMLLHGERLAAPEGPTFHPFGMFGGQGVGKTMCLAALLRVWVTERLRQTIAAATAVPYTEMDGRAAFSGATAAKWLNWPSFAAWSKTQVMGDRGAHTVDAATVMAGAATVLILDDLGRERLKGNYDEDFAVGILDRLVDERARRGAPILWTSNLGPAQLATRYGAALASRLMGLAPAIEVPPLADLRLHRTPE